MREFIEPGSEMSKDSFIDAAVGIIDSEDTNSALDRVGGN